MNYFRYLCAALFIAALASCHDHSSHGDKDHEHDHEHTSAEAETTQEPEGHSDEIVFHSEKAAAAGIWQTANGIPGRRPCILGTKAE